MIKTVLFQWPDFGVPQCPDTFLEFLHAVRNSGSLSEDVGPAIVHCSAGIGRSGTFCLGDSCLVLVSNFIANLKKIIQICQNSATLHACIHA